MPDDGRNQIRVHNGLCNTCTRNDNVIICFDCFIGINCPTRMKSTADPLLNEEGRRSTQRHLDMAVISTVVDRFLRKITFIRPNCFKPNWWMESIDLFILNSRIRVDHFIVNGMLEWVNCKTQLTSCIPNDLSVHDLSPIDKNKKEYTIYVPVKKRDTMLCFMLSKL